MKKNNLTKSLATLLAMSLVFGSVPVSAAEIPVVETEAIETEVESETDESKIETETETSESVLESEAETDEAEEDIEIGNFPSGGVAINATNFPDSVFRDKIKEEYDSDKNGNLSYSEVEKITELIIPITDIRNIKGIEYFFNLEIIDVEVLELSALDVSQNTKLRELNCSDNKLTQLDVSKNTNLRELICNNNNLTQLDVSKNTNLRGLYCSNNNLTQLDISKNPQLEYLYCPENQLLQLDVSKHPALKFLACSGNNLSQLDVSKNPELRELRCGGNNLTQLDVSKNPELRKLFCLFNELTQLDVSKNPKLDYFDFGSNHISAIDLSNNYALNEVYGNNQTVKVVANKMPNGKYVVDFASLMPSKLFGGVKVSGFDYNASTGKLTLNDKSVSTIEYTYTYLASSDKSMNVKMEITYSDLPFHDVAKDAWYYAAVKYVYENGLLTGTSDTTFSPNGSMTRGMLVSVLYRMAGRPEVAGKLEFSDVAPSKYYAKAIQWASENGIVSGYSNGKFGPEDPITREQMTKVLYQFVKLNGGDVSHTTDISSYKDASEVAPYAARYVKWAVADGILKGSNGKLNPKGNATRAEVSAIMKRVIETYNLK